MHRKPGFPIVNCNVKLPEPCPPVDPALEDDDRSQRLISYAHSQWGFNNWSWSLNRQDVDYVDFANGEYTVGVASFVAVNVKSLDIHRENMGYATCSAKFKGSAIYKARKFSVTNALRETLISFGGNIASELREQQYPQRQPGYSGPTVADENNQNLSNQNNSNNIPHNPPHIASNPSKAATLSVKPQVVPKTPLPPPPMGKALPMPGVPRPNPNPNVSFVLQPVLPPLYAPPPPRIAPPHPPMYPNYYEYSGPWHFTYEPYDRHGNVNLNFNIPPKNLVVNGRAGDCKNTCKGPSVEGDPIQYGQASQGCWIKPTIFYDGFWTEQKVKKWVAEQVEKQFPDDALHTVPSPGAGNNTGNIQEPPSKLRPPRTGSGS